MHFLLFVAGKEGERAGLCIRLRVSSISPVFKVMCEKDTAKEG